MVQRARDTGYIDINCVDPLGRSGLLMAIDNENLEMVELLIEYRVETKDALLHAISEEYVEAVEVLLDHEETIHKEGEPHVRSWPLHYRSFVGRTGDKRATACQTIQMISKSSFNYASTSQPVGSIAPKYVGAVRPKPKK